MASASTSTVLKKLDPRRVSSETLCSSNSSCVFQKRKPLHPLATSIRSRSTATSNPITQRVLSAKLLRFKSLQNQLHDANYHIAQLVDENKLLKNLQKRQDNALSRYEGTNAQLPQMLESHQEELRILQTKNKTLRKTIKELTDQLKQKDDELNTLKDQNKHLLSLSKNRNLEEREKLNEKVEELNDKLKQSESTISVLNRRLLLEGKNYKYKLSSITAKHKQTQREFNRLLSQNEQLEGKGKFDVKLQRKMSDERKSQSVIHLCDNKNQPVKKLIPNENGINNSVFNISEDTRTNKNETENNRGEELNSNSKTPSDADMNSISSSSEIQLKQIVNNWQKRASNLEDDSDLLNEDTLEAITKAQQSNALADKHKNDYETALIGTDKILDKLQETDLKQEQLYDKYHKSLHDYKSLDLHRNANAELMAKFIINEKEQNMKDNFEENLLCEATTKRLSISEPEEVDKEHKRKLIATLKAIDNGDNVIISDVKKTKNDLMKELFGS